MTTAHELAYQFSRLFLIAIGIVTTDIAPGMASVSVGVGTIVNQVRRRVQFKAVGHHAEVSDQLMIIVA